MRFLLIESTRIQSIRIEIKKKCRSNNQDKSQDFIPDLILTFAQAAWLQSISAFFRLEHYHKYDTSSQLHAKNPKEQQNSTNLSKKSTYQDLPLVVPQQRGSIKLSGRNAARLC